MLRMKLIFYLLALYATFRFQRCNSDAIQPVLPASKSPSSAGPSTVRSSSSIAVRSSSSIVLRVTGKVYPTGYYYATVNIGNPPKPYFLDIDTGSDLTWVQCDAPCINCLPAPHPLYKPTKDIVPCSDPLCRALQSEPSTHCDSPNAQCDYDVQYADDGSSFGILVRDIFSLQYINGSIAKPRIAFGCGYDQEAPTHGTASSHVDGVLGLGLSKVSILSQLTELGVTKNVVGHCLGSQADGYLFFGDQLVPSSGVTWTPMSTTEISEHYSLGRAELYIGGKTSGIKDVNIVFDSGSTYTYFIPRAYDAVYNTLLNDIKQQGNPLNAIAEDNTLPRCWKGPKPFKSVQDVKNLFKPITLSFANSKNVWFQMNPEAYLIISEHGNACLGILNGADVGLESFNLIGDISFHDKLVIYDNEKKQIGWAPANCNNLPKSFLIL